MDLIRFDLMQFCSTLADAGLQQVPSAPVSLSYFPFKALRRDLMQNGFDDFLDEASNFCDRLSGPAANARETFELPVF